ncbi:hypothetical protein B0H21DRAFT_686903 [Amylocystis lapponica]|nr:hypothetical protein B0H21DRAFT_686903 [Amylocystis lapponica]
MKHSEPIQLPPAPPPPVTTEAATPPPPPSHILPPRSDLSQVDEKTAVQSLPSPSQSVHSARSVSNVSGWVIWSHRPQPSRAPGLIISPNAYPPEDVVHKALDLPSPPVSPQLRSLELPLPLVATTAVSLESMHEISEETSDITGAPSSSATETTPPSPADTPVPGSPVSSNTSVSIGAASPSATMAKPLSSPKAVTNPEAVTAEHVSVEIAPSATSATSVNGSTDATTVAVPLAAPPVPKPAAPKKSWASLLQSSDAAASSSKSRLPVSSVVGFSIPAATPSSTPSGPGGSAGNKHRQDLLNLITSGLPSANSPLRICPRGLVNTGNMCFANSVLQVLIYCQPFHRLFAELSKHLSGPVVGSQKEGTKATPLIDAVIQFLKEFVPRSSGQAGAEAKGKEREDDFYEPESFIPSYVYDAMKEKKRFASMIGGHQEDAEEFLGFFLDTLEEELLSLVSQTPKEPEEDGSIHEDGWMEVGKRNRMLVTRTIKSTDSPITRMFGGKFRSTLQAPHQKDSVLIEDWRSLRLDIQRDQVHTIKDALQSISQKQPVQITSPTRPGVVLEAQQQALIESLPPILILHLKRFHYDTNVGDVVKIGKQVAFGPELDIGPDLIAPNRRTSHPVKYQLFGVLYHHGLSASGGHYTLDVLHPNRDLSDRPRAAWIRIDDELVSDIRPEDVFGGTERDDRCAYLLFYRRMSGWGASRT